MDYLDYLVKEMHTVIASMRCHRNAIHAFACIVLRNECDELMKKQGHEARAGGTGSVLSTASGLSYSGSRFDKYFGDFKRKCGISDMYSEGLYPFETPEKYWAWWSRHAYSNR